MDNRQQGSVLLMLIAAMLILLSAGTALVELFGTQRMATVDKIESAQSFWSAEAGAWHAAQTGAEISTAVDFAGTTYTVTKSGDDYTSTAERNGTIRVVTATLAAPTEEEDEEESSGTLLDESASAATAYQHDDDHFHVDLVSIASNDLEIESIELNADNSPPNLKEFKLDNKKIIEDVDEELPTGVVTLNDGSSSDRTIEAGDDPEARIRFKDDFDEGTTEFTLTVHFTDGSSDAIDFSVTW